MKTSRNGWVAVAVTAGLLIAGGAPTAWGAAYSWDGAGSSDNSGNWSVIANWNPESAGKPAAGDDVTLPNVTTGTRTVTLDAARNFRTLTINQSTAGATNRLLFGANLTSDNIQNLLPTINASAGTIVIDKGNYTFEFTYGSTVRNWILGPNVILNSSGGVVQDGWQQDKPNVTLQGIANFSTAVTTMGAGNTFTVDTTGVLNLTSGGGVKVSATGAGVPPGGTFTIKGTINGNSTGSFRSKTVDFTASSAMPSAPANMFADNLVIQSATPANFDMSSMTLSRFGSVNAMAQLEAAASGTGSNFKIGTLYFGNVGGTYDGKRNCLVNTYANSAEQASEYFLVGTFNGSAAYQEEFDFNGQRMVIDGGVANYSGYNAGNLRLSNRSAGNGVMEFRTTGGQLDLKASIGVSGGGTLQIVGPASIINARLYSPSTGGGTIAFNGNFRTDDATIVDFNNANSTTTLDLSGNTFTLYKNSTQGRISVSSNATFIVKGNVSGEGNGSGYGLRALGTTKSGAGAPVITPSGTVIVSGNVSSTGQGLTLYIGRDASFKVGGNFSPTWWNGLSGAASKTFFADMSPNAGSFIFNGGGASVQTMEVLSRGYTAITGLSDFQRSGTAPAAGQTVTGGSSGATATINFINGNILQLTSVTGTFQADETLNFSGTGTARAYDTQFTGLDGQTVNSSTAHLPIGTLSIGDPAGTNASVKLVNSYNPWGVTEDTQAARSLTVTTNSTFDLASFKMVVVAGTNSTVAGLITNSVAGGTLILANGATLKFATGGTIDVDTLTIGAGCTVDFNRAQGSYIRVNGDQKAALDALIAGGQIVDNGGNVVKASYSADDAHTTVDLVTTSGSVFTLR